MGVTHQQIKCFHILPDSTLCLAHLVNVIFPLAPAVVSCINFLNLDIARHSCVQQTSLLTFSNFLVLTRDVLDILHTSAFLRHKVMKWWCFSRHHFDFFFFKDKFTSLVSGWTAHLSDYKDINRLSCIKQFYTITGIPLMIKPAHLQKKKVSSENVRADDIEKQSFEVEQGSQWQI